MWAIHPHGQSFVLDEGKPEVVAKQQEADVLLAVAKTTFPTLDWVKEEIQHGWAIYAKSYIACALIGTDMVRVFCKQCGAEYHFPQPLTWAEQVAMMKPWADAHKPCGHPVSVTVSGCPK